MNEVGPSSIAIPLGGIVFQKRLVVQILGSLYVETREVSIITERVPVDECTFRTPRRCCWK
jgi:hypothetical protein